MNLTHLSPGDAVVIRYPTGSTAWEETPDTVARTTQTMIMLAKSTDRFWRRSGEAVGRDRYATGRRVHIEPYAQQVPQSRGAIDEQWMAKMRQDVQAAAAVFEVEPTARRYEELSDLVSLWKEIACV